MKSIYHSILCYFLGHVKYVPEHLHDFPFTLLLLNDIDGSPLVKVNVCSRCGVVYSDLPV